MKNILFISPGIKNNSNNLKNKLNYLSVGIVIIGISCLELWIYIDGICSVIKVSGGYPKIILEDLTPFYNNLFEILVNILLILLSIEIIRGIKYADLITLIVVQILYIPNIGDGIRYLNPSTHFEGLDEMWASISLIFQLCPYIILTLSLLILIISNIVLEKRRKKSENPKSQITETNQTN